MKEQIEKIIYIFAAIMLVASVLTADEPLSVFIAVGLASMYGGPRYLPGILGLSVWVIGIAISLVAAFLALVIVIALIAAFSMSITGLVVLA